VSAPAASQFPPGDLRVSDADRDRAISELSEHFQAGRITADELEERSGLALSARTGKDLAVLFADLPQSPVYRTPPATPTDAAPVPTRRGPAAGLAVVALAVMVVSVLAAGHSGHPFWFGLWPLLVVLLILRLVRRGVLGHEHWQHHHEHWHEHRHVDDEERDRLR
jgi:hypothetical protein